VTAWLKLGLCAMTQLLMHGKFDAEIQTGISEVRVVNFPEI